MNLQASGSRSFVNWKVKWGEICEHITIQVLKYLPEGRSDCSPVKTACYSCKDTGSIPRIHLGISQLSGTPVIGDLTFSSGLLGNQALMWCTCMDLSQYTCNKSKARFYSKKNTEYILGPNWYFPSVSMFNIFGCIFYANMVLIVFSG